ncbi:MAG: tetratricopeptide repeat protein [bacterium]
MFRYGLPRILLILLASASGFIALLAVLGIEEPELTLLLAYIAFTCGVLGIDLARSGRRVLADFRRGRYDWARRGTLWLLRWTLRRASRATLQLNLAACHLAAGTYEQGGEVLRTMDRDGLPEAVRGIWENNYAYYVLSTGGEPREALGLCDQASTLNPTNPAFRSTRGIAQLALGRIDDAIAELQAAVDVGLETQGVAAMAENYYHLARAWESRGETAYARDHYLKSVNIGPETLFGRKSADRLQEQHNLWPA